MKRYEVTINIPPINLIVYADSKENAQGKAQEMLMQTYDLIQLDSSAEYWVNEHTPEVDDIIRNMEERA